MRFPEKNLHRFLPYGLAALSPVVFNFALFFWAPAKCVIHARKPIDNLARIGFQRVAVNLGDLE